MTWRGVIFGSDLRIGHPNRLQKVFSFWSPEVDHRPAQSLGRACLRLGNIKEGLDMIEEYVISR
jgi:hypothetical protein